MSDVPPYRPDEFADPSAQQQNPQPYGRPSPYGQPSPYAQPVRQPQQVPQPMPPSMPYVWTRPEHPQAQMVFILGIVGIFTGIVSFVAWYMGGQAKKEIEAGAPYAWDGQLKTGYVLGKVFGIITIVFTVLGVGFWILYAIFVIGLLAMGG